MTISFLSMDLGLTDDDPLSQANQFDEQPNLSDSLQNQLDIVGTPDYSIAQLDYSANNAESSLQCDIPNVDQSINNSLTPQDGDILNNTQFETCVQSFDDNGCD